MFGFKLVKKSVLETLKSTVNLLSFENQTLRENLVNTERKLAELEKATIKVDAPKVSPVEYADEGKENEKKIVKKRKKTTKKQTPVLIEG